MKRLICLFFLILGSGSATSAPLPKELRQGVELDFTKLHARIAEAVKKGDWNDRDTERVEAMASKLLTEMSKAAAVEEKKIPLVFKDLDKTVVMKIPVAAKNCIIVGEDIQSTAATNCVIIASGNVKFTSLENCVVIAKQIRCTVARNSVLIANEIARATSFGGRNNNEECIVVAGERVRATTMRGGFVHVLRPGTGTPPDDDRREDKPIVMTSATGVSFFAPEEKLRFAGKDCKWIELKAPLSK